MLRVTNDDPRFADAVSIIQSLRNGGYEALLAGGCVRDLLLNRRPKDYDVATAAKPDEVARLFPEAHAIGRAFGVMLVPREHHPVEVATFRRDIGSSDGRHPDRVEFADSKTDAMRRDFTVNALFFDPASGNLIDYVGGQADLQNRVLRTVGTPTDRFREDYLRLLRAIRFATTLDFKIEDETWQGIVSHAPHIRSISAERIAIELTRTLTEAVHPGQALQLLHRSGLLAEILPEVAAMDGVQQPPNFHPEGDVLTHVTLMLDAMTQRSPELAWSVLLHDVGKPPTFRTTREPDGSNRIRFDRHARVGSEMATKILERLRMSNEFTDTVTGCVDRHMQFIDIQSMRPAKVRTWMARPSFPTEMELHRLDCGASNRDFSNYTFAKAELEKLQNEVALPAPWVTGHDLIKMGFKPGPALGEWRQKAYEAQLDGTFADADALRAWLLSEIKAGPGGTGSA